MEINPLFKLIYKYVLTKILMAWYYVHYKWRCLLNRKLILTGKLFQSELKIDNQLSSFTNRIFILFYTLFNITNYYDNLYYFKSYQKKIIISNPTHDAIKP